jgi:hypothetical protein
MFHRSEKALRYEKELDEARLNGHFHLVPNLARKLQKHDPSKQCIHPSTLPQILQDVLRIGWARSAVYEKTLNDLVAPLERHQHERIIDGSNDLYLPPTIPPEKMKEIVTSMDEALNSSGTVEEKTVYTYSGN